MMRTLVRSPFAHFSRPTPRAGRGLGGWIRVALLGAAALLGGCSSPGSSTPESVGPRAVSVSLIGYGSTPFELVSETHTSRVELYSSEVAKATTKILHDEVMVALVEHLDELGFAEYARVGSAPTEPMGDGRRAKAIQVRDGNRAEWWPLLETASRSELQGFQTAMRDFLDLYNISQSWQSVDNNIGGDYFDQKKAQGR